MAEFHILIPINPFGADDDILLNYDAELSTSSGGDLGSQSSGDLRITGGANTNTLNMVRTLTFVANLTPTFKFKIINTTFGTEELDGSVDYQLHKPLGSVFNIDLAQAISVTFFKSVGGAMQSFFDFKSNFNELQVSFGRFDDISKSDSRKAPSQAGALDSVVNEVIENGQVLQFRFGISINTSFNGEDFTVNSHNNILTFNKLPGITCLCETL